MNEDYLWNKTGSDPEVEWLESSLNSYAFKQTSVLELPAKQFIVSAASPSRISFFNFRLGLAAVCVAIAAFAAVWMLVPSGGRLPVIVAIDLGPQMVPLTAAAGVELAVDRDMAPIRSKIRPQRAISRSSVSNTSRPQTLVLTKEEADAYRQLMTALSVTSTNLKIVKDALHGGTE